MLLEVENLTKKYPGNHGIRGLDLTVSEGEVVALLGSNGAGKTTAMKTMMGFIPADGGSARYNGLSIWDRPESAKKEIGMMMGEPSPYLYLTAYQYMKLHLNLYSSVSEEEIMNALKLVELEDRRDNKIKTFSTGMKQRICLARVLLIKPRLLLLDEPFSGMDIEGRSQLVQLLWKIVTEQKVGMILSSHLIHDIEQITTKVCIISDGRWLETRPASEIKTDYPTIEAYYLERLKNKEN